MIFDCRLPENLFLSIHSIYLNGCMLESPLQADDEAGWAVIHNHETGRIERVFGRVEVRIEPVEVRVVPAEGKTAADVRKEIEAFNRYFLPRLPAHQGLEILNEWSTYSQSGLNQETEKAP